MDILILGNGFDLAHGLNTRYSDFLKYCQDKYNVMRYSGDKDSNFLYNNVWIKHFLNKKISGDKWIDLEKEIYNVIAKLSKLLYFKNDVSYEQYNEIVFYLSKDYMELNFDEVIKYFHKQVYPNNNCYFVHIKDFVSFLYEQLRDFIKEFEKYLIEEKNNKIANIPKYKLRINKKCISLLNFNYTDICEELYGINFSHNDYAINTKAVYVHGKIGDENNCNLVLGTHSFDNEQIPVVFNIFKKHHQRHKYRTIEQYQELLNELKYPQKIYTPVFHIVGHSLDKTDHAILRHILLAKEKSVINIYYHNEEALARMQSNIDLIIGEDEVMSRVRFIRQDDPEQGIFIPIEEKELINS